jgi:hypothetical protein
MAREILYKKEVIFGGSVKIDTSPKLVTNDEKKVLINTTVSVYKNESLVEWLKSHPLVNISALCREASINRSNFDKSLKMGIISPKHENKLVKILKNYGYGN